MRRWLWLAVCGWSVAVLADEVRYTFDATAEGWMSLDAAATANRVTAPGTVKEGTGALEFRYEVREGALPAVGVMDLVPPEDLCAVDLWVQSSETSIFVLAANEADGSSYNLPFYLKANQWTRIEVRLDEFVLGDDQTDENDRLDPDQVQGLVLLDAAIFLQRIGAQAVIQSKRTLRLDDVRLTDRQVEARCPLQTLPDGRKVRWLGPMQGGSSYWLPVTGSTQIIEEEGKPVLHWKYRLLPQGLALLLLPNPGSLQGARAVRLRVRCPHNTVLGLSLEERLQPGARGEEPSYGIQQPIEGSPGWQTFTLPIEAFVPDPNKPDPDGKLDLTRIASLMVVDAAALMGQAQGEYEIWIGGIVVEME